MRAPRFVFLTDGPREDDVAPRFGWRLTAANRRPIGRGVVLAASLEEARADVERVRRSLDQATSVVTAADARWSWRLRADGSTLAVSVRAYLRRVECARGLRQFVTAAALADPAEGVLREFGPNALRGYEP